LKSIDNSTLAKKDYEIIVVDNASSDGTVTWLKNDRPDVQLIENKINRGFGVANNQAVRIANGSYCFFLNPDTQLDPNSLEVLLNHIQQDEQIGAVGCTIVDENGEMAPESKRRFPSIRNVLTKAVDSARNPWGNTYYDRRKHDEVSRVEVLSGCCMLVRKEAFLEIGGFDEQFFLFGEDVDLCKRLHEANYQLCYTPNTQVIHYKGRSTKQNEPLYFWHFYKSAYLYALKHDKRGRSPIFKVLIASGAFLHGISRFIYHKLQASKQIALRLFM
jgi:GT2 family glycosyltransferase